MTLGNSERPAPWTVIGYRADGRPIHLLAGGSGADDDDDDSPGIDVGEDSDDEGDEPDEEGQEEQDKPKPKPPAAKAPTQADLDKVAGALDKERAAAKAARVRNRELEAELRAAKKAAAPKDDDDEVVVKAVEAARAEETTRFKPMIVNKEARLKLVAAGLAPDTPDAKMARLLKMIDLADVDLDEDGEVSGLDEQVDQIKESLPELFAKPEPPAPKLRAPKIDAADRRNQQPAPKTTGEIHAASILGRG